MEAKQDLAIERERAFALVCALLNPFRVGETAQPLSASPEDAARMYEFACAHGVRPALLKALLRRSDLPPAMEQLRSRLAEFQVLHRFAVMQATGQIIDLARAFERAGLDAMFFKGATLGEQIYGGAQFREFNDIDVLVRPADRERTIGEIEALKFQPIIADPRMRRGFFDYLRQHSFRSTETGAVVDFHWAFVGTGPFPVSTEQALSSRTQILLGGTSISVPSAETQALILAGHGHKENWASFGWILDFATFAAVNPDLPWDGIASRARAQHCLEPLLGAVLLVERVFDHTIDPQLAALGAKRLALVQNISIVIARSKSLTDRQRTEELMGGFRLCETPAQRFKMAASLLITPSIGDFETMPLPYSWWWMYRLTRPLRLLLRKLRGLTPEQSGSATSSIARSTGNAA